MSRLKKNLNNALQVQVLLDFKLRLIENNYEIEYFIYSHSLNSYYQEGDTCETNSREYDYERNFKCSPKRNANRSFEVDRTTIFDRIIQTITIATEAKYPAFSFEKQLTDLLMKIYGMILDNLKKELSPFIGLCILAPKTSRETLVKGRPHANVVAQQTSITHWQCKDVKTMEVGE
ncbi:myosin-J heavy chain [Tanacetum coccineum]